MSTVKSVCVYCGSSGQVDEIFKQSATALGKIFAEAGIRVVFGGGRVGLMGLVSDAAMMHGGTVIGIIPEHIAEKEIAHSGLTELHVVESMHERKQMMVDRADAFVILPGGLGTMDEFFEILTWWQLGLHDKPIVIANIDGYWTPLLALIDNIIDHKFARQSDREYLSVVDRVEDILDALQRTPRGKIDVEPKWR